MPRSNLRWLALLVFGLTTLAARPAPVADGMLGFTSEAAARQAELEARFDSHLSADNLREWMQRMTEKPLYVGSPHNRANAEWTAEQFREWGYEAEIVEYQVLFPMPRVRRVEMVAPEPTQFS